MMVTAQVSIFGFGLISIAAFFGALGAAFLVYNLARVGGRIPVVNLLLAGFAVSSLLVAIMSFLMVVVDRLQLRIHAFLLWLMGGVMVTSWEQVAVAGTLVGLGTAGALTLVSTLNAFSLGEEGASYLGVSVERQKALILAIGSLLTGAAVSVSGLVGFIGLVVPHGVRLVLGPNHRLLLPASAMSGAIFLIMADLLARTIIAPAEIPLGILTALVGGPFFLYLLKRSQQDYRF